MIGCRVNKPAYNPTHKFPADSLRQDFQLLRQILESKHPGLYWYTPKDSMDRHFDSLYRRISDSMTEQQFGWQILGPLTSRIRCGHTSFSLSKNWSTYIRGKAVPGFPFHVKVWGDTMIVTRILSKQATPIPLGAQVTAINDLSIDSLCRRMFLYLPTDGYANNVQYTRLSTNFPYYHRNIFGLYRQYRVRYIDSAGVEKQVTIPWNLPQIDTTLTKQRLDSIKRAQKKLDTRTKKQKRRDATKSYYQLAIDARTQTAHLELNTFSKGKGRKLRRFMRRSFRKIEQQNIKHLILDLRSNGGGDVSMYVLLTRYLRHTPFRVADTAVARAKSLAPYGKHFQDRLMYSLGLRFLTHKKRSGAIHFGYWERHTFQPKRKYHYNGKLFVLTNGPTFSASPLFTHAVKDQANTWVVGEETGGGWYGNSGIMIPEIVLPTTKIQVRIPLFRLVQAEHERIPFRGSGIVPDVYIPPTAEGVRNSADRKLDIIRGWIRDQQFPVKKTPQNELRAE
jgi:C-terminal processing protease CtpA/Prc